MTRSKALAAAAALAVGCSWAALAPAQVSINIGAAPECPYGYFDYPPYNCAPPGYYGPEWFNGGIFLGAGPWFHGPRHFYGHVDNHFDPRRGYHGDFPARGERPDDARRVDAAHFHGNERRDGHGDRH